MSGYHKRVYFILSKSGGCPLIKIGTTDECPYLRLEQLRRAQRRTNRYARYELMGVLPDPSLSKNAVQKQFSILREHGDWFRPGTELLKYIRESIKPHICRRSCPDGTMVYEEWHADQEAAAAIAQAAFGGK